MRIENSNTARVQGNPLSIHIWISGRSVAFESSSRCIWFLIWNMEQAKKIIWKIYSISAHRFGSNGLIIRLTIWNLKHSLSVARLVSKTTVLQIRLIIQFWQITKSKRNPILERINERHPQHTVNSTMHNAHGSGKILPLTDVFSIHSVCDQGKID